LLSWSQLWKLYIHILNRTASHYNYHDLMRTYKPLFSHGVHVIEEPTGSIAWFMDYDANTTTLIPVSCLSALHVQARSTYKLESAEGRIKSQLNVIEKLGKMTFSQQQSTAYISYFVRLNLLYRELSESKAVRTYWYTILSAARCIKTILFGTSSEYQVHNKTCFRGNPFKAQKAKSTVTCDNPCCSDFDTKKWQTHSDCAHKHVLVPKQCTCNGMLAIKNRQNCHISDYSPTTINHFSKWVKKNYTKLFPGKQHKAYSNEAWLKSLPPQKRLKKSQAVDEVANLGILNAKQCEVQTILKNEFCNRKDKNLPDEKQPIDARIVSGREAVYDVIGGPIIKKISKMVASWWNFEDPDHDEHVKGITYCTGKTKAQVGSWMKQQIDTKKNPIFYNTDYKRFDASTNFSLLAIEASIYQALHPNDTMFKAWLSQQLVTNGRLVFRNKKDLAVKAQIKYFCYGTRKSGDQNTSIGNTILNVMMQLYALEYAGHNVTELLNSGKLDILALGDDTVICTDGIEIDQETHVKVIRHLGLIIQIERKNQHTVTFCSSYFVPAVVNGVDTFLLTQKLGRNLSRAYNSAKWVEPSRSRAWVKSNAFAYQHDMEHIPFMYAWHANKYARNINEKAVKLDPDDHYKHLSADTMVCQSVKFSLWAQAVYGFTDYDCELLADMLSRPIVDWEHELLTKIFDVDVYGMENFEEKPFELDEPYKFDDGLFKKMKVKSVKIGNIQAVPVQAPIVVHAPLVPPPLIIQKPQVDKLPQPHVDCNLIKTAKKHVKRDIVFPNAFARFDFLENKQVRDSARNARVGVQFSKDTKKKFYHPVCRGERHIILAKLLSYFEILALPVYDFGTRIQRNLMVMKENRLKLNLKGCQPKLDQRDNDIPDHVDVVRKTMQEVMGDISQPTNCMMVDVLYYITPNDIGRLFCNPNVTSLYSVNLQTHTNAGTLVDEVSWVSNPIKTMVFNNATQQYEERNDTNSIYTVHDTAPDGFTKVTTNFTHKSLEFWEDNTIYAFTDRNGVTVHIAVEIYSKLSAYEIIRFTRVNPGL
jgi:hypothetical protein